MSTSEKWRRRRVLTEEERSLWNRVAETLEPLKGMDARRALEEALAETPAPPAEKPAAKPAAGRAAPPAPQKAKPAAPPLSPFDRRTLKRLVRGRVAIDGRIDLHGLTQSQAHSRLHGFLAAAQARGEKTVLVITGKGAADGYGDGFGGGERGILRRVVPQWLQLPEFRHLVAGYEEAHGSHGGAGALYVRIRRDKRKVPR